MQEPPNLCMLKPGSVKDYAQIGLHICRMKIMLPQVP